MIILIIIIEFGLARIYGHTPGESPAIGVKSWFIRNYAYRIGSQKWFIRNYAYRIGGAARPVAIAADDEASVGPITEGARPVASAAGRDASAVGPVAKASQPASCGHILGARMRNSRSLIMMTWAHPPRQLQKMPRIEVRLLREIRLTCPCPCPCLCRHPTPRQSQRSP